MKPVIFYHANCADGMGAAFSAWKVFGEDAEYIPVQYGMINSIIDVDLLGRIQDRDVFILDFSFPRPVMEYLVSVANHVTWLDHHKTAFEMWTPDVAFTNDSKFDLRSTKMRVVLDNQKSGAMLAWEFFNGPTIPHLIAHIDDYDRW